MSRWKPDGRRRLQDAALELYAERGFAEVTAAAVAERAGLTERTFFRHFPDKKEILFGDEEALRDVFTAAAAAVPDGASPLEATLAGLKALTGTLQPRRERLVLRTRIIRHSPDLRERELVKLASWAAALAGTLRERGLGAAEAQYAAETATTVFRVAFERWTAEPPVDESLFDLVHEGFAAVERFLHR
ncbi:TetR family transcriptional regulator [Streptomyces sp. NPDC052040]|uniref:TetR family transcriptional regulator n=1 Tax=unclassified Streptomyces TaxID=2593676 RepID=UPI0037D840CF